MQSAKLIAGYIYADAGNDESTQDLVYSGHDIIAENGSILAPLFFHKIIRRNERCPRYFSGNLRLSQIKTEICFIIPL